ncbi:MAG TPA: amino acid adenylation domain-containing protein [Thermoanaerobaculia bacterium]|nr:amino acid adenylation domain-containing protein [Thermoanaerobaculia bacterium]
MSADRGFKLSAKRLELLRALRREQGLASTREEAIPRQPEAEGYPLSFNQQRLWFLDRLHPGSAAYNLPVAMRLEGPLRLEDLARALAGVVERQTALRTVFAAATAGLPGEEGAAQQRVLASSPAASIPLADLAGLPGKAREAEVRRLLRAEALYPFDLERGPLFRFSLLRLGAEDHAVLVTVHHIAADALSLDIFIRELSLLYAGQTLPKLPVRYVDYAAWQRAWAEGGALEEQLAYWRRRLAGAPTVLELPVDRQRPEDARLRVAVEPLALPGEVAAGLLALARREEVTPFMTLFGLLAELLRRHTGHDDLLVGSSVANRQRPEVAGLIGFFVNTLVLRAELAGSPTFRELLGRVRETTLGAFAHQDLPFERLVEEVQPERRLGHMPLFQVMLAVQPVAAAAPPELPGLRLSRLSTGFAQARIDLALSATQGDGWLHLAMEYSADLFDATTVQRLLARLAILAAAAVAFPEQPVASLSLLTAGEHHQVLREWNDWTLGEAQTAAEPLLHRLFEARVAAEPERPALVWEGTRVTYRELNRRANGLAHHLRAIGVGPDSVVGLYMDRSPDLIAALLGVLKAGGAYLPLDPEAPAERTAFMVADGGVRVALADERRAGGLAGLGLQVICPPFGLSFGGDGPDANLTNGAPSAASDHLAYVIYTSGSTGKPKGVMVSHRAACGTLLWRLSRFHLTPDDCILQNIAFTFDPSIWQIFGALLSGARLVLVPPGGQQDFAGLVRTVAHEGVTITDLAPPMLEAFLEQEGLAECHRLRLLFAGGQALPAALAARFQEFFPAAALQNIYGPTEVAIDAATWTCRPLPAGSTVPIGRPVAGRRLLVLDGGLAPVPIGVAGELYIGAAGLARGYLGRPGLTAERFLPDPWVAMPGARFYRTGDLVRQLADGLLEFLGRVDRQVKIRGFRVELGEVEEAVGGHPEVRETAVVVGPDAHGQPRIIAYYAAVSGSSLAAGELRSFLRASLPSYMVPAALVALPALPRTVSGKVDPQALPAPREESAGPSSSGEAPRSGLERSIAEVWREVLGVEQVGVEDNFFDRGGHSLLLIRVHSRLQKLLDREIPVVDLFNHPTIAALARHLGELPEGGGDAVLAAARSRARDQMEWTGSQEGIAIVGLAGRFPGAADVDELWANLRSGRECIRFFSDDELLAAGVPSQVLARPNYVKARGVLDGIDLFDAPFFDIPPREAEMTDPQHRLFLESAFHALEHAGYDPGRYPGAIGVYAGVSANMYLLRNVLASAGALQAGGENQAMLGGDKDFLATRLSYKLNLRGPSFTVQTACSTSLVATHLACRALLGRECDMALAGGVSATVPQVSGYHYQEGGISSPDGHCRAFDAQAQGTVGGSGVGVVVLKRLSDALAAGDTIHAVIRGTAINNDGAQKVGYTAPGVDGQAGVIAAAQALAGVSADEIGYVEAHGTGTPLGDPIEIAALTRAFRSGTERTGFCAIGSVKTNLGHLDAAAGIAGLIKTTLVLEHGEIPPSLHFREPNPRIDFAASPFFVNAELRPWAADGAPRRAGVSSFGIGGTNAHAVLESAPAPVPSGKSRPFQLLMLSARTSEALEAATDNLAAHLLRHPELPLADAAYTLQTGRRLLAHRRVLVALDAADAAAALSARDPERLLTRTCDGSRRQVVFLFPGQGAQYAGMGRELYEREPAYRSALDSCAEILGPHLGGLDLLQALHPEPGDVAADRRLQETGLAQPALFAVEYALARLWMEWGVRPEAMLGHSLGEYVAACLAGVFSLEDALALVAARGRLMQSLPAGAMLAVPLPEEETAALLGEELSLAAVNAPSLCVVSGPEAAIEAVRTRLAQRGLEARRLHTSHAFHSAALDPILEPFRALVSKMALQPPRLPYLSNLTGTWIEAPQATDPDYWVSHLRQPVRFAAALSELLREPGRLLLEVGPGRTLSTLARRQSATAASLVESMRSPADPGSDLGTLLTALGRLWLAGVEIAWEGFHAHERRRRVPLPLYPFERKRYWIEPSRPAESSRRSQTADWLSELVWKESMVAHRELPAAGGERWLLLADSCGLGAALAARLSAAGRQVVTVDAEGFAQEDGVRRLADLRESGLLPTRIVDLRGVTPEAATTSVEADGEPGFLSLLSLLRLAAALQEAAGKAPLTMEATVVANGLCDVTGDERLSPEKAALLGLGRMVPLKYPEVGCRAVDVVLPPAGGPEWEEMLDALVAELAVPPSEPLVVLRGSRRLAASAAGRPRLAGLSRPEVPVGPDPIGEEGVREPEEVHSRPDLANPYAPPRTETESALAGIWEEVLGIGPVGIHDDFHQLGGHSLLALQVLSRVRRTLGSDLPLRAIFDAPTVARLAVRLLEGETVKADDGTLDDLLAQLEGLSDEEAEALLASEQLLTETHGD